MKTTFRAATAPWLAPRLWLAFGVLAIGAALAALRPAAAQDSLHLASAEELREIVGPIALYPDDLVAIVLPASTYPLQVVQAARFLQDRERDSRLQANDEWDDSIVALLNYPEVVELMNDDLDWTYDLGTAVLNQRADVLNAIQGFRDEAYAAGNLRSDERQTVARNDNAIEIKPANPQVIYVPYYEPERVVVYQPAPVYYYYPRPYPVYYYPYPAGYRFNTGFFWGVNSWFSIGWHSRHVHVYDPFFYGHPYYGWNYYDPFFVRNVYVNVNRFHRYPNYVWEPRYRYGGRPVVRGSEGRVYAADRAPRSNAAVTRTREGAAYRATAPAATGARAATSGRVAPNDRAAASGAQQPRRDVTAGSAYRSRSVESTERATQAAQENRAAQQSRGEVRTNPGAVRANPNAEARTNPGGARANPNADAGTNPGAVRANPRPAPPANPNVSPRAYQPSTGMPREASRAAPAPRQSAAPPARAPSDGGAGAQRSESGGGYRGNAGGGNGGYRGGSGGSQRAAPSASRGSEGRSAGR